MMQAFDDASGESVIKSVRLSEQGALECLSTDGLNLLHLCMASEALRLNPFSVYLKGGKCERVKLLEHLLSKPCNSLVSGVDCYGMTVMHAASLLFTGLTPPRVLTETEIRPKKGMVYLTVEQKVWAIARTQQVRHILQFIQFVQSYFSLLRMIIFGINSTTLSFNPYKFPFIIADDHLINCHLSYSALPFINSSNHFVR